MKILNNCPLCKQYLEQWGPYKRRLYCNNCAFWIDYARDYSFIEYIEYHKKQFLFKINIMHNKIIIVFDCNIVYEGKLFMLVDFDHLDVFLQNIYNRTLQLKSFN